MHLRSAVVALSFSLLLSSSARSAVYTYALEGIVAGADSATGMIQTNCDNCTLGPSNIVNWDIIVRVGSDSGELNGPLSPGFSQSACDATQCIALPAFGSVEFVARPTGLYFNFYDFGGYMWFRNVGIGTDLPGTQLTFCSLGCGVPGEIEWQAGPVGSAHIFFPSTNLVAVAVSDTSAAVPEPATWALLLFGFGLFGALLRARGKKGMLPPPEDGRTARACGNT